MLDYVNFEAIPQLCMIYMLDPDEKRPILTNQLSWWAAEHKIDLRKEPIEKHVWPYAKIDNKINKRLKHYKTIGRRNSWLSCSGLVKTLIPRL